MRVECRPAPGRKLTLVEIADELRNRLTRIFLRDENGADQYSALPRRCRTTRFQGLCLFDEYFDGDNGRGAGASHQTGSNGLIANLIDELYPPKS